jgi:LPS sulfotransferase NodH
MYRSGEGEVPSFVTPPRLSSRRARRAQRWSQCSRASAPGARRRQTHAEVQADDRHHEWIGRHRREADGVERTLVVGSSLC